MKSSKEYESIIALLPMAVGFDDGKVKAILERCKKENKVLVAVYPGVPNLTKGIDISQMELIGSIIDGSLYLK
jgi:hypothetical protein